MPRAARALPALAVCLLSVLAFAVAGCGGDAAGGEVEVDNDPVGDGLVGVHNDFKKDDRLRVATTVAPLTSIILNIGGNRIYLNGLIPDGVDSHTYEPKPSDAAVLSRADIFILNGAGLEGTTEELARQNLKNADRIYKLAD